MGASLRIHNRQLTILEEMKTIVADMRRQDEITTAIFDAQMAKFEAQMVAKMVELEAQNAELKSQNAELKVQNAELEAWRTAVILAKKE